MKIDSTAPYVTYQKIIERLEYHRARDPFHTCIRAGWTASRAVSATGLAEKIRFFYHDCPILPRAESKQR
jgi:hypothetical protein